MSNLTPTIQGYYPLQTFFKVRDLWPQMARKILLRNGDANEREIGSIDNESLLTTPESFRAAAADRLLGVIEQLPQFCLLQSPRFQALLTGQLVNVDGTQQVAIEMTFSPVAIDLFIAPLIPYLPSKIATIADPDFTNDSELQSEFTSLLLAAITGDRERAASERESHLQQQVAQANLLNYIIAQIHQKLDLPAILQAAVEQVQTFLRADRLIIYQFEFKTSEANSSQKSFDNYQGTGKVTYESIGGDNIQSVLDVAEHQDCFDDRELWDKYRAGMTRSLDRVNITYADDRCMLDLMERSQIQSKLVVPIVINSELWGLLIAHQCHSTRQWQVRETEFLQQVATHLALAIDRAELHAIAIDRSHDLEQRVNERTRELRDLAIVAQTANQSKTEFLALLSHELRTPLTSILGLSATLLRLPLLNLTDRQQNYLQIIHNSGEHLSELIDDILDFYKLEVGKTFLKVSEFSLTRLVEQVVEIVKSKAEQRKIDLELQIIKNVDTQLNSRELRFRGDTKRVRQILLNILTNAIKFTPEGGTVVIRAWLEDCYAVFEVEDSGIGIEEDRIPYLFKKFHQLDRTFNRDYGGMGLGLAITQQLVELHGGSIEVDSIVGSGSTFTVRLASQPLQVSKPNDWQEMDRTLVFQDPELNPIPNRAILIEQDEDLANFICDVLTAARYQVTWFLSAESSFRQISMFKPDLLIIDLALDAATVDRAIDNIRKSTTIGELKMLAIATKEDIISPTCKQHVDDYLWKPVNPEQLLR
ncbi:ATP-binding protein, partial [Chamaesiphon sp. VAR_69_metabat_338]|uniref:ATP-binding protein n=1 Tax=Chamaesiphon sp. VAR_69_metabat_338 TaxID=2964704 RepID=UPI00286DD25C